MKTETFDFFDISVEPGTRDSDLHVLEAAGVPVSLPIYLINGNEPGPTMVVTAGIHGAEYPCVEAALRLGRTIDPQGLRGQLLVVPIANPLAFWARSIYITPPDGKNLNRQFPGDAQGTFSRALAHWLFQHVIRRADYFIDLHGGDMIEALIPFSSIAQTGDPQVDQQAEAMAQFFGLPYIGLPSAAGSGIGGATHLVAGAHGIPALLSEAGGQGILDEESVTILFDGVRRVLQGLKMTAAVVPPAEPPPAWQGWTWLRAKATGLYYPTVAVGDRVTQGESVGKVTGLFGEVIQQVDAPQDGQVLFVVTSLPINPGDPLLAIAG